MADLTINMDALTDTERAIAEFLAEKCRETEEAKKKEGKMWKPEKKESYYLCSVSGLPLHETWSDDSFDKKRYSIGNCFKTKEEAEFACERLKVITELERFALENNPADFDLFDKNTYAYQLKYSIAHKRITTEWHEQYVVAAICFASEPIAYAAVDKIGADRLKKYYFCVPE